MENITALLIIVITIKSYSISVTNSNLTLNLAAKIEIDSGTLNKAVTINANHSLHLFLRAPL
jgi:hypothetical protein